MYYGMIMAGGSGTRLWPLSREARPKQALRLFGGRSLFQHAVERLDPLFPPNQIWIATRREQQELLHEQAPQVPLDNYLLEPQGRGTAPAIGLAAIHFYRRDPEAVMAVLTADHYIQDIPRFQRVLQAAETAARQGHLVTLGIRPSAPSTAYGYIEQGKLQATLEGFDVFQVRAFTEKPNRETAARMVSSGLFSWNSGMFIWQVKRILEEFHRQMPEFYEQLMEIDAALDTPAYQATLAQVWPGIAKQTIDYGVMEGAHAVVVIPVEMGWSDVGSWSSLYDLLEGDDQGNAWQGENLRLDAHGNLLYSESRLIAAVGVKDLIIIDAGDALLVCGRDHEQQVRAVVEKLRSQGREELL